MKICFSTCKTAWTSKLIRFFTKDHTKIFPSVSHCFFIIQEDLDSDNINQLALSADDFIVDIVDVDKYRNSECVLRVYEVPERIPMDSWIKAFIASYNQRNYGWFDLAWFMWRWVRRLFNKNWNGKNPINMGTFCSELVYHALVAAGYYEELKAYNANSVDATEIENIIVEWEGVKLIERQD
jgi:hypothetical protein